MGAFYDDLVELFVFAQWRNVSELNQRQLEKLGEVLNSSIESIMNSPLSQIRVRMSTTEKQIKDLSPEEILKLKVVINGALNTKGTLDYYWNFVKSESEITKSLKKNLRVNLNEMSKDLGVSKSFIIKSLNKIQQAYGLNPENPFDVVIMTLFNKE